MVHALHEAWRILRPQGILIDLRPLCADAPLEIVFTGGCDSAGLVIAAGMAMALAVSARTARVALASRASGAGFPSRDRRLRIYYTLVALALLGFNLALII